MRKKEYEELAKKLIRDKTPVKTIKSTDYKILGIGKTRVCIKAKNENQIKNLNDEEICIKIPYTKAGVMQNNQEVKNWDMEMLEIREYLLPILESHQNFKYIVMPIGIPLKKADIEKKRYNEFKKNIKNRRTIKTIDMKKDNCVLYNGNIKMSDYGMLHKLE